MKNAQHVIRYDADNHQLICRGNWDIAHYSRINHALKTLALPQLTTITINGEEIKKMDTAGAWLMVQLQQQFEKKGIKVNLNHFTQQAHQLLTIVEKKISEKVTLSQPRKLSFVARRGKKTIDQLNELQSYLAFVGQLTLETLRLLFHPAKWRWGSLASIIYTTGYQALFIIALLSFLIGVVIAYQMGLQLQDYGANIYIVDFLGLSILREFAPLMTAIMVSGRTGSSFTASLGMMKLNQEIDALNTMSVTPGELLLLPRILGLFIVLPLLTIWSDIFGIIGGMVMANNMLGITWHDFLQRFPQVIPLRTLLIGVGKAPVFALLIASIGCFEGMRVKNSAASVGQNTTKSVVLAIFFIIVADAIFSIILSKLKL